MDVEGEGSGLSCRVQLDQVQVEVMMERSTKKETFIN